MTDRSKATTHAADCWSWGPAHYECAVREIERLRKMHQDAYQRGLQAGSRGLREMYDAVQVVKRQDAWGNTQLTEALMEAEERAERAEAENKRLREELSKMRGAEPSDEEIDAVAESMPDGAGGMLKQWGYRQFARALLARYAAQPTAGEEIMVNAPGDVYTLPMQPSGLTSGPRFVVHVPGPEQPAPDASVLVEALELARRTLAMAAIEGEVTRRIDSALAAHRKQGGSND